MNEIGFTEKDFIDKAKELSPFNQEFFFKEVSKKYKIPISTLKKVLNDAENDLAGSNAKEVKYAEHLENAKSDAKIGKVAGINLFFDIVAGKYLFEKREDRFDEHGKKETIKRIDFLDKVSVKTLMQESSKVQIGQLLDSKDISELVEWVPAFFKAYNPHKPEFYSTTGSVVKTKNMCVLPEHLKKVKARSANKEEVCLDAALENIEKELIATTTLLRNLFVEDRYIKYFINWLAYAAKNMKKTRNAIVIVGEQGTGKGVLWDNIIRWVFGQDNCVTVGNADIASEFNVVFDNRLFVCFNEIKGDFRQGNTIYETLKSYITDPTFMVNIKNVSQYEVENHFNCIFFSNHEVPLQIEGSDRRYSVFKTANTKLAEIVGDTGAFIKTLKDERERFLEILFSFSPDVSLATSLIDTEQKKKIKELSNTKQDNFKSRIIEKDYEYFEDKIEEALEGRMEEPAIDAIKRDSSGMIAPCYLDKSNREMLKEFKANIMFGVFSNKVLKWAYRVLIKEDENDNTALKFWTYVLDEKGRIGKERINVRYLTSADKAVIWGKFYVRDEKGKWSTAGDAADFDIVFEE